MQSEGVFAGPCFHCLMVAHGLATLVGSQGVAECSCAKNLGWTTTPVSQNISGL